MSPVIRISTENYESITTMAEAEQRSIYVIANRLLEKALPKVPRKTMNRTRKSIGGG